MKILVVGAGRVGARVIVELKKNPMIKPYTLDPRERPFAVEEGVLDAVDFIADLNPRSIREVIANLRPDLVLVTTSAEDIARLPVSGLDVLVESLQKELKETVQVPVIAVSRRI